MSSEMIERVARALCASDGYPPDRIVYQYETPSEADERVAAGQPRISVSVEWKAYVAKARRVVQAMREPTAMMLAITLPDTSEPDDTAKRLGADAFSLASPSSDYRIQDGIVAGSELVRDWRNMIDAALKEPENG